MRTAVIVVGAGPAGLAAAASARHEGLDVVVVDERNGAGGRRAGRADGRFPTDAAWWIPPLGNDDRERPRIDRLTREAAGAEFVFGGLAWGLFAGFTVAVTRAGRTMRLDADQVILATGSYVVRPPFAGHELDAVLTPAAVIAALDAHELGPEASIAVLGDDALADQLIADLRRRKVASVTRLAERPTPSEVPVRVLAAPPEVREAGGRLTVDVALADGGSDSLRVDALVVADAQVPATELAAMIGCRHRFAGYRRGFVPIHGADGSTTVDGVFVAGALTGTVEAEHAERSGRVAGLAAAVRAGRDAAGRLRAAIAAAPAEKQFPETVPRAIDAIDPHSAAVACRCIGVGFAAVAEAVRGGARSLDDVKRQAKAGMGTCQGRDCQRAVLRVLERVGGVDLGTVQPMRVRPPIRPITAGAMYEGEVDT